MSEQEQSFASPEIEPGGGSSPEAPPAKGKAALAMLSLTALGVVYGDIGTSPLYALKECFRPHEGLRLSLTPENVLGILSLFFWSLTLVVVIKYLIVTMRADNQGEGGILALLALVTPAARRQRSPRRLSILIGMGLFGAALLGADGMITPAISVLSAVEGLEVATTRLSHFVVPITLVILVSLFVLQRRGTAGIGMLFGPAMLVWFATLTVLGLPWIIREPSVLGAVSPHHAILFFWHHGVSGFLILGAVVLCITGAEALYADMGHFGRPPIKLAWFSVVFPALLVNYFGQGALLLERGEAAVGNPFYALAPGWALYPTVVVATAATVIASQALISGAFSLAQQAIQLGYSPRLTIVHTSSATRGQIFVPEVNRLLMVACCGLVLSFRSSSALAAAYGIAVTGTMAITSILLIAMARNHWGWSLRRAAALGLPFLIIDLVFFSSNLNKILHGGWFPLVMGAVIFAGLSTWKQGRELLARYLTQTRLPMDTFLKAVARDKPMRVKGTAVFMTSNMSGTPVVLMHHFKHNKVLHEQVILLCVSTSDVPEVPRQDRVTVRDLGEGFYLVTAHYGFMQTPDVHDIFRACRVHGLKVEPREASFYLGRETLIITRRPGMAAWRKSLFAFLSRNSLSATAYFGIPPNRVVELGAQLEL